MSETIPAKCKELISALTDGGWSFFVSQGSDTGNSPFVTVEAKRESHHIMITWHTRATGTYRLFSCMINKRDATLTKAMEAAAK